MDLQPKIQISVTKYNYWLEGFGFYNDIFSPLDQLMLDINNHTISNLMAYTDYYLECTGY